MMIGKMICVQIAGKKAKVLAGADSVDEYHLRRLFGWLPKVEDFDNGELESVSFVPIDSEVGFVTHSRLVTSRTVGTADVTSNTIFPVAPEALLGYFDNPALLTYFLYSSGAFSDQSSVELLPERSLFAPLRWAAEFKPALLVEIARSTQVHDRGIIIRADDNLKYLASVYSQISSRRRWNISFAVSSRVSGERPFCLHVKTALDRYTSEFVAENQIRYFDLTQEEEPVAV